MEILRHNNIEPENRICKNAMEDEYIFLFICPLYNTINKITPKLCYKRSNN